MTFNSHIKYQTRIRYLEEYDPQFGRRRRYFIITCIIRGLISGLQDGIFIPSAWEYLLLFDSAAWQYGLLLASSKISATFSSLLLGRLYDKTKRLRCIIVAVNIIDIIGSLLSVFPLSFWFLLIGRLLSGIGSGFTTATNSEIAWITQDKERATVYAKVLVSSICGIMLGPALRCSFQFVDLEIGYLHLDYRNFPGLLCAILWLVALPASWLLVNDLARQYVDVDSNDKRFPTSYVALTEENDKQCAIRKYTDMSFYDESHYQEIAKDNVEESKVIEHCDEYHEIPKLTQVMREILSPELLVLIVTNWLVYVYVYSADTGIPLFAQKDFGWKIRYTSVVYLVTAVETIIAYTVIGMSSDKVSDWLWVIIGILCTLISSSTFLFYQYFRKQFLYSFSVFCVSLFFGTIFAPFFGAGGRALLTKVIHMHSQGTIQGFFDSVGNISAILGPVWGVFGYGHVYLASSMLVLMSLGCLIWFLRSSKKLKSKLHQFN